MPDRASPAIPEIVLVRHGRSAHAERAWIDVDGLRRWMQAYDAADISADHPPPPELIALAAGAERVLASDLPRAVASAAAIAPGREASLHPLLREAPLETEENPFPRFFGLRMPLMAWALLFGARWLGAKWRGAPPPGVDAATLARAEEAAAWLVEEAEGAGGRIVVVTHATFRSLLGASLVRRGWVGPEQRPLREWSAWSYRRGG